MDDKVAFMIYKNFNPKPVPTLMTILMLFVLIALGSWQIKRLYWKNNIISEIKSRISLPVIYELPENDIENMQFRSIKLRGEFLHDKEMHLYGGGRNVRENGYFILTPFKTDSGKYVLVNRGWLAEHQKDISAKEEPKISTIEATILKGEKQNWIIPNNEPGNNLWFWIDLPAMETYTNLDLQPFYVLKKSDNLSSKDNVPIESALLTNIRNNHLGYALTWYSMAIALIVIYFLHAKKL